MDARRSWERRFTTFSATQHLNVVVQTDGGHREGDCAASSWVIGLWDVAEHVYEPLATCGTFLENSCTVFVAEAIAIDESSARVQRILQTIM